MHSPYPMANKIALIHQVSFFRRISMVDFVDMRYFEKDPDISMHRGYANYHPE